jgi:L-lactate dehydrogenase complex protein LldG
MRKDDFLRSIRSRLEAHKTRPIEIPADWGADVDDRLDRFGIELVAAGGHFHRSQESNLSSDLRTILSVHDRPRVLITREDNVPPDIGDVVAALGGKALWWPEAGRAEAAGADVGITSALWGVAETGSVLLSSAPPAGRAPSLLPSTHITILPEERLLTSIAELFERIATMPQRPSNLVVSTGPSKSGDIENELVTGIHGPKAAHVVVVSSDSP